MLRRSRISIRIDLEKFGATNAVHSRLNRTEKHVKTFQFMHILNDALSAPSIHPHFEYFGIKRMMEITQIVCVCAQ